MSTITRFAVRSSGRDVSLVRRPVRVTKVAKAVATPVTVPDQGAVTVTKADAGDAATLGVTIETAPAKPAKAAK